MYGNPQRVHGCATHGCCAPKYSIYATRPWLRYTRLLCSLRASGLVSQDTCIFWNNLPYIGEVTPKNICIFTGLKKICMIEVSGRYLIQFWKRNHCSGRIAPVKDGLKGHPINNAFVFEVTQNVFFKHFDPEKTVLEDENKWWPNRYIG